MMEELVNLITQYGAHVLLIFLRIGSMFILSPIFGRRNIPNVTKVILAAAATYIAAGMVDMTTTPVFDSLSVYVLLCIKEVLVGFTMSFIMILFFAVANICGQFIDLQVGFGMAQIFDPLQGSQVPVTGSLLNIVLILNFLLIDGHLVIIRLVIRSFEHLPPEKMINAANMAPLMVETFGKIFVMGIAFASPIMVALLFGEVALGLTLRTVPQMNMFVIGIPLKILLGLILLSVTMPTFITQTQGLFEQMYIMIENSVFIE